MKAIVAPDGGPPPHTHRYEDETFYILEGECGLLLADEWITAGVAEADRVAHEARPCPALHGCDRVVEVGDRRAAMTRGYGYRSSSTRLSAARSAATASASRSKSSSLIPG